MYPLKFQNLYYKKIWGGKQFEEFRNNLPKGNIGESWDIACHNNGMSIVLNGKEKGKSLEQLIDEFGEKLIGTKINKEKFPLLIKLINAEDNLSIQVHPNDEYAKKINDVGKTEVWYVLRADEGSKLTLGLKNIDNKEELKSHIYNNDLKKYLNEIYVKEGEVYFIKSGLIHGIGKGITVVEIQQNSDITYRIYDYDRGRELKVDKALDVIDLNLKGKQSTGLLSMGDGYCKIYLCLCKEFSLELYDIKSEVVEFSDRERFYSLTCVEGMGRIYYKDEDVCKSLLIGIGESIFIPASMGKYKIEGRVKILKSYVPDVCKVENEVMKLIEY